jgi:hypothetical protein
MSMASPPSPDKEITLPAGMTDLRSNGLRQRIRHGAMREGAEQSALAIHVEIARGPDRRRAHVAGEHRIFRRKLVQNFATYWGWIGFCPGSPVAKSSRPLRASL